MSCFKACTGAKDGETPAATNGAANGHANGGGVSTDGPKIVYTYTDEAPMLATYSLLPMVKMFTDACGVAVECKDISVAGRILGYAGDYLTDEQKKKHPDQLSGLGNWCKEDPTANVIKLPNISASVPQVVACIKELQSQGFNIPDYPADSDDSEQAKKIREMYGKSQGSTVNPVLREGNSDRRVAPPVKEYAKKNPHKMGAWKSDSKSHVSHMDGGDFYESEQSFITDEATEVQIVFKPDGEGEEQVLKKVALEKGEVCDSSHIKAKKLDEFFETSMKEAKEAGILWSLHMKATMMKVSDPIIFGRAVRVYYKAALDKHADVLKAVGFNANNGIGDLYSKLDGAKDVEDAKKAEIKKDVEACYATQPDMAMVNSSKGITNLHVPSDVIIDASMPVVVRDSGMMWNKDDALQDVKCCIPDRSYAGMYKASLDYCRKNGQFDVATMGNVPNVGLMAKKAEEYGSHDKTFQAKGKGKMEVRIGSDVKMSHDVDEGDIFRACQTKDAPIRDWVKLACKRSRLYNAPAIFWLDENRAHDNNIKKKVEEYLKDPENKGWEEQGVKIMNPVDAINFSMERCTKGENTISATGNVLRDYLTDLFPILELGTSAKMLSIVPMLKGGGMYETGAGGSAPKHVQQFQEEGHLRWDSLGEYLALACSLEAIAETSKNPRAKTLGDCLNNAVANWLDERKAPSRKKLEIDNRLSNFYLAFYWAKQCATQTEDAELKAKFEVVAKEMGESEEAIKTFLSGDQCQGKPVDIGGYYKPDPVKTDAAMRPCKELNDLVSKHSTGGTPLLEMF